MNDQWWVAVIGNMLIWSRLRVLESGSAEVLDCDGNSLHYDSEDSARAALLDAEFVAFDGMDEADANEAGFSLQSVAPPTARDDEGLREQMIQRLPPLQ